VAADDDEAAPELGSWPEAAPRHINPGEWDVVFVVNLYRHGVQAGIHALALSHIVG